MNEYCIGDYGRFQFTEWKKGTKKWFSLVAEVKSVDGKCVLLIDNDDFQYLPYKKDIEKFKREDK